MRTALREHLADVRRAGRSLVTHDPLEAMVLADRLLVVEDGRVVQEGTPAEVSRGTRPSTYVARLVGLNLYAGSLDPTTGTVTLEDGGSLVTTVAADRTPQDGDTRVLVALQPSAVAVHTTRPDHVSARNVWPGTVVGLELLGDRVRLEIRGEPTAIVDVTPAAVADLGLGVRSAGLVVRQGDRDGGLLPRRRRGVSPTRRRVRGSGHPAPQDPLDCQSGASTARRTPADRPDCQSSGPGRAGTGADRTAGPRQTRRFPSRCRRRTAPG